MTGKPNSVCEHCDLPIEQCGNRWISNGMFRCWGNEMEHCHEPVAEPAEPSASYIGSEEERIFMEKKALGDFATVSAEPAAERPPSDGLHIPSDSDPRAIAAPQPVAACTGIVACIQKEACLKVNRCLINLPQPVAGEGPQGKLHKLLQQAKKAISAAGHKIPCGFSGCTCGAVNTFKLESYEFWRQVQAIESEWKVQNGK